MTDHNRQQALRLALEAKGRQLAAALSRSDHNGVVHPSPAPPGEQTATTLSQGARTSSSPPTIGERIAVAESNGDVALAIRLKNELLRERFADQAAADARRAGLGLG